MFDLNALELAQIHTEAIAAAAKQACMLRRCMPATLSGSRRALDVLGTMLIEAGTRLKAQARAKPQAAPASAFIITL